MKSHYSITTQHCSEEDIKQAIIKSSKELSQQLNPDYPIYHQTKIIRYGDLPPLEQKTLKQALSGRTADQLVKYQF